MTRSDKTSERLVLEPEMCVDWQGEKPRPPASKPMGTGPTIERQAGRIPPAPATVQAKDGAAFHKRVSEPDIAGALGATIRRIWANILGVLLFSGVSNMLVLAIPIYLFQISDRVLTSRSIDTLVMLTVVIVGAVLLQVVFDAIRRGMLLRSSVDISARLGAPITHVLTAESAGAYKPRMQAFEYMFDTLGCGPQDIVHVSSSFRYDLMTAHDLGITNKVWVNRGHEPANPWYGYTEVADISGLPGVLGL